MHASMVIDMKEPNIYTALAFTIPLAVFAIIQMLAGNAERGILFLLLSHAITLQYKLDVLKYIALRKPAGD